MYQIINPILYQPSNKYIHNMESKDSIEDSSSVYYSHLMESYNSIYMNSSNPLILHKIKHLFNISHFSMEHSLKY